MFESYKDIFNQRGDAYHKAMLDYPGAREREFRLLLDLAAPSSGETLMDMPSGGGYLRQHIREEGVRIFEVETSPAFHAVHSPKKNVRAVLCDLEALALDNRTVDVAVSLAGLHHAPDFMAIFNEVARVLKPEGRFCLADVAAGSKVDRFLNRFVDQHNSMGHHGVFIDERFRAALGASGFRIDYDETVPYTWDFPSVAAMADYVTLMFGLDRATPDQVVAGIEEAQGFHSDDGGCRMNWELRFIRCHLK